MKKLISLFLVFSLLMSLFTVVGSAEEQEFDVYMEAEDYFSANVPLTITNNSKMSNGKHVKISTDNSPQDGMFYINYRVTVPEEGAYDFKIDTNFVAGFNYSELLVSVNGGEPVNMYLANNLQTQSSGLSTMQLEYLKGFRKGENNIRISLLRPRARDQLYTASFDYFTLKKANWGISDIKVIGQEFFNICERGSDISLDIEYSDPATDKKNLKLIITDYYDKEFYSEEFTVNAGETGKHIDLPEMDINHYTVKVYDGETALFECYISVVKPLAERNDSGNSPYGVDSILSILGNIQHLDDNLGALKLAGVSWLRDRFVTDSFTTSEGVYNYDENWTYAPVVIERCNDYGFNVLNMLMSIPSYLKGPEDKDLATDNLVGLYEFGYQLGKTYGNSVKAWELLNEPENNDMGSLYENETADKLVANYAAMSIGLQDATDGVGMNTGGYAPTNKEVMDLSLRNNVQDYVNVIDFHSHTGTVINDPINRMRPDQRLVVLQEKKNYGLTNREMWNTEMGISGGSSTYKDADMQHRQAEYTVISHAESLEYVNRCFAYIFNYKSSHTMNWFSYNSRGPYKIYNTYSAMTDILNNPEYIGKLIVDDITIDGYLYKNNDQEIMVLFSDDKHTLKFDLEQAEILNILGHNKKINRDSDGMVLVDIGPEPVYVRTNGSFDKSIYTPNSHDEIVEFIPDNTETERVLITQYYPYETTIGSRVGGYQITEDTTMVEVKLTNLNDKEMKGVLSGQSYNGWKLYPENADVTVKPFSTSTHTFMLEKTDKVIENMKSSVEFIAEFDDAKTNPSVTDVVSPGEIKYEWTGVFDGIYNPESYSNNIAGGEKSQQIIGGDGKTYLTHKFVFDISVKDKWVYPRFYFDKTQNFGGSTGIVVRYEAPEDFKALDINSRIYIYEENGSTYLVKSAFQMKKGINEVIIPWTGFKRTNGSDPDFQLTPSSIAGFSLGLNSANSSGGGREDIPEYKIHSIGVYNMITDDPGFSEVVDSYPKNNSYISESPKQITATFSDAENKVKDGTVYTYIDGHFVESEFADNVVTVADIPELSEGEHEVEVCYQIGGVSSQSEIINFIIDSNDYSYIDVDNSHWAKTPIEYLSYNKTLSGIGGKMFNPEGDVTRAEFVKMIVSAFGMEAEAEENAFADVSENDWYYSVVNTANACGILDEIYSGSFMGDTPITRQEMAALLYRAVGYAKLNMPAECVKKVFIDKVDFAPYASEAISALQQAGVLEGRDETHFVPLDTLTRAEAAKAIYEVLF